jgi:hypothetical protein
MLFIGIDNGVSGSIAILDSHGKVVYFKSAIINNCLDYTKSKRFINRIDGEKLAALFFDFVVDPDDCICYIERPMVNPMRFRSTVSALRAMEATLIVLELLKIPYQWIDSKEWQKKLLPSGLKKEELKKAAVQIAKRKFPKLEIKKDADGLLIAYYAYKFNGK